MRRADAVLFFGRPSTRQRHGGRNRPSQPGQSDRACGQYGNLLTARQNDKSYSSPYFSRTYVVNASAEKSSPVAWRTNSFVS